VNGSQPLVEPTPPPWVVAAPVAVAPAPVLAPAGFWRRAFALAIDAALVWLLLFVGDLLARPLVRFGLVARAFDLTFDLVVPAAYFVLLHGTWGRTAGKALAGVLVLTVSGEPLGYARALLRHVAWLLSVLLLLIGFLMVAARSDKRALHDLIAGTRVVRVR
jgi:uncharacterized RDD family membrane protein YckC